ncbi:RNase adapter RapZ [Teichococcus oryzae]|uniref:RNase adapter RapZ n=1 Tax=Teichococcus oryzae TaxID=1608942 RepID=UPI001F4F26A2|nr:RNase adapter RapZ [Pseudoroseomonas oryzae]
MSPAIPSCRPVVVVTGLSGAGKATVLRMLEDLGFESIDNPPLSVLEELVGEGGTVPLAIGVDARTRGFDAAELQALLRRLRAVPGTAPQLLFVTAEDAVLLRRFSETRRRHPMAPGGSLGGSVADGIAREQSLLAPLRDAADWVVDTTDRPLPDLRRLVERHFRPEGEAPQGLAVAVMSFAFPRGLPREADLVLDLRFLRNPHYDPVLRPKTGQDPAVAAFVRQDPDFAPFWQRMTALLDPLLPRYAAEGKKYLTVALGCTGGKHRSVLMAELLSAHLAEQGWRVDLTHRELRAVQASSTGAMAAGGGELNIAPPLSTTGREAPSTCTL